MPDIRREGELLPAAPARSRDLFHDPVFTSALLTVIGPVLNFLREGEGFPAFFALSRDHPVFGPGLRRFFKVRADIRNRIRVLP